MWALDPGLRGGIPEEVAALLPGLGTGSVCYHFLGGGGRPPLLVDDFSVWLEGWGGRFGRCREGLAAIDFHLWSLTEMRALIAQCLRDIPPADVP